jgi:hypothetical protein
MFQDRREVPGESEDVEDSSLAKKLFRVMMARVIGMGARCSGGQR